MKWSRLPGRLVRTRARKISLVVALVVLVPVGCVSMGSLGEECPRPLSDGKGVVLFGTYEGPHGMEITLSPQGENGRSTVAVGN